MVQLEENITANSDKNNENLFTKLTQDLKKYSSLLGRSLAILWTAAPIITAFLILVSVLESIIPAVTIGINKYIVDTVAAMPSSKEYNLTIFASLVSLWIAVTFLANLCGP